MKARIILVVSLLMGISLSISAETPEKKTITWAKTFGESNGFDQAESIQQTEDGGYVVVGTSGSYGQYDKSVILVIKRKAVRLYPDGTRIALYWSDKIKRVFSLPYGPSVQPVIQAEEFTKELAESEQLLLNDGNSISLNEETKQKILTVYEQLDDDSKEVFWQQLTESISSFGKLYEFCRLNSTE